MCWGNSVPFSVHFSLEKRFHQRNLFGRKTFIQFSWWNVFPMKGFSDEKVVLMEKVFLLKSFSEEKFFINNIISESRNVTRVFSRVNIMAKIPYFFPLLLLISFFLRFLVLNNRKPLFLPRFSDICLFLPRGWGRYWPKYLPLKTVPMKSPNTLIPYLGLANNTAPRKHHMIIRPSW